MSELNLFLFGCAVASLVVTAVISVIYQVYQMAERDEKRSGLEIEARPISLNTAPFLEQKII